MPFPLRFTIVLVLSIVCLATPAWADFQTGVDAYNRKDYATALREWKPLAEQGNADAQYNLGLMYDMGYGVPQDYVQARQWYEKAVAQGDARAQYNLGVRYARSHGVPQDYVQAHKWFNLAAANGEKRGAKFRDVLLWYLTSREFSHLRFNQPSLLGSTAMLVTHNARTHWPNR